MRFSRLARSSHQRGLCLRGGVEPGEAVLAHGVVADPDAGEVLADAGPAVVQQDGATRVEGRRELAGPVRAQLGLDALHQLGVEVLVGLGGAGVGQPELAEQVTRGRGEDAVCAGDRRGDLVERGGVDRRALAATGGRQVDAGRPAPGRRPGRRGRRRPVRSLEVDAEPERPTAGRGPVAEAGGELGEHVGRPTGSELPDVADAVGDRGRLAAGRAGELVQVVAARPR